MKKYIVLFMSAVVTASSILYSAKICNATVFKPDSDCPALEDRIKRLEPETPKDIDDPPFYHDAFPTKLYPVSEVISKGIELPLDIVYSDPNWKRQAYKSYWHSTVSGGRWSYVPNRIHYGMHRLFTTYTTASIYYDFINDLGIEEESNKIPIKNGGPFEYIKVVVMQGQVQRVITYGNQVVLIVKPTRYGLQSLDIPVKKLSPANKKEPILFQLVTEQGDEIDYSLISYVDPNVTS